MTKEQFIAKLLMLGFDDDGDVVNPWYIKGQRGVWRIRVSDYPRPSVAYESCNRKHSYKIRDLTPSQAINLVLHYIQQIEKGEDICLTIPTQEL